ncbi:MAG: 1,4-dihydroxy-2-naphthoate polyprenyltransferase [Polyangiales bacterium]
MSAHEIKKGSLQAYVLGARPKTLLIAVAPVMVGVATAVAMVGAASVRWAAGLAALLGAVWITIGTNFANDVFDYEKGADTAERLGPTRVTQAGLLTPSQVRAAMVGSFAIAMVCGAYLLMVAGWPVLAIGIVSIVAGIAYTGGPFPLGYNGLGEVFVFVFFGLVAVCGTVFVSTGAVGALPWLMAIPSGALASCVLLVNNVRDVETDTVAGKRTLAVRFGRPFGVKLYVLALALAYGAPALAVALGMARWPAAVLPLLSAPLAVRLAKKVNDERGELLNARLGQTAALLLLHSVLLSLALVSR